MGMFSRGVVALAVVSMVAGCATPGRPGSGIGAGYTPIVDMQGVDSARYQADLTACQNYARNVNVGAHAVAGAVVGAVAIAAILGGARVPGRITRDSALVGGALTGAGAAGRAEQSQERITKNCLAGRGYRVLDHTGIVMTQAAPTPAAIAAATPAPAAPAPVLVASAVGQDSYQVERMAREQGCDATAQAGLTAKGPGFETYVLQCKPGDVWSVRCEFGQCRVLR